jgi:ABC-type transport system involved in multi-copper enzyme maturation permease subunit
MLCGMPPFVLWVSRLLPTNPIVVRLVEGGSRRLRHLYIRSGYLAIMMLVLFFSLLQVGGDTTMKALAQRGASAFAVISFGQVALLCLLTPIFMAGAIAQESSPRTWDILLTTPLTNLQIVLGTLFGRLFFVLALLMSTLPLFATTQFFGGVPGESIFLSYAIAACSALLVAAIAVTLSVTRSAGKRAVFVFYITVVMYLFVTYAADLWLRGRSPVAVGTERYFTTLLTPLNPFLALESLLQANSYVIPDVSPDTHSWLARTWIGRPVAAFCWLCVLVSVALVGYSTLQLRFIGTRGATIPWWKKLTMKRLGGVDRPARTVGTNPIAWRERTSKGTSIIGRIGRWLFVAAGAAAALAVIAAYHFGAISLQEFQGALVTVVVAEIVIVTLAAINLSGVAVSREREDGTLDLLLTTPIQPGPYLSGKLQGLVQYLLPMILVPFISLGLAALYVMTDALGTGKPLTTTVAVGTANVQTPIMFIEGAILVPIVLVAFIAFCVMVGLQWSIKSKGTIGSVIAAFGVIVVVAGILGLCGVAVGSSVMTVGPVLNALSPVNLVLAVMVPQLVIEGSLRDLPSARIALAVGSLIAAATYIVAVISMHTTMKRTFMMTVRRLAGTN